MDTVGEIGSMWISLFMDDKPFRNALGDVEKTAAKIAENVATTWANKIKQMTANVQSVSTAWMMVPIAINQAIQVIEAAIAAVRRFYDMAKEGAQSMRIEAIFENVASSLGIVGDNLVKQMSDSFGRTIENTKLQAMAMRHLMRGLDDAQIVQLSKSADTMAKLTGQNAADVFEQLANASEMMMIRQLQRLRLVSKTEMADINKAIGQGLIGTADIIDEISRKTANMNSQMKPAVHDWADIFQRFGASWDALYDAITRFFTGALAPLVESFTIVLDILTKIMEMVNFVLPVFEAFAAVIRTIAEAFRAVVEYGDKFMTFIAKTNFAGPTNRGANDAGAGMSIPIENTNWQYGAKKFFQSEPSPEQVVSTITKDVNEAASAFNAWFKDMSGFDISAFWKKIVGETKDGNKAIVEESLVQKARRLNLENEMKKQSLEVLKAENAEKLAELKSYNAASLGILQARNRALAEADKLQEESLVTITQKGLERDKEAALKKLGMSLGENKKAFIAQMEEAKLQADIKYLRQQQENERLYDQMQKLQSRLQSQPELRQNEAFMATLALRESDYLAAVDYAEKIKGSELDVLEKVAMARKRTADAQAQNAAKQQRQELDYSAASKTLTDRLGDDRQRWAHEYAKWDEQRVVSLTEIDKQIGKVNAAQASGAIGEYQAKKSILDLEGKKQEFLDQDVAKQKELLDVYTKYRDVGVWVDKLGQQQKWTGEEAKSSIDAQTSKWIQAQDAAQKHLTTLELTVAELKKYNMETAAMQLGPVSGTPFITGSIRDANRQIDDLKKALIANGMDTAQAEVIATKAKAEKLQAIEAQYYAWWGEKADDTTTAIEARFLQMAATARTTAALVADFYVGAFETVRQSFEDVLFDAIEGKLKTFEDYMRAFTTSINRMWAKMVSDMIADWAKVQIKKQIMGEGGTWEPNMGASAPTLAGQGYDWLKQQMGGGGNTEDIALAVQKGIEAGADVGMGGIAAEITDAVKTTAIQNVMASTTGNMVVTNMTVMSMSGMMGGGNVVESSGASGLLEEGFTYLSKYFGVMHEGGIVGATDDSRKLQGGLQHDEVVAVLQKGEVVIPKGGLADFIDKFGGARAAGGAVAAGMGYLTGEQGRELFAPSYGPPRISASAAKAAEEAYAAIRVSAMEAKDLAQYKTEYDKFRKYELEKEAWDKEHAKKAAEEQEGGGLASYLPTALMTTLAYGKDILAWGKGLFGPTGTAEMAAADVTAADVAAATMTTASAADQAALAEVAASMIGKETGTAAVTPLLSTGGVETAGGYAGAGWLAAPAGAGFMAGSLLGKDKTVGQVSTLGGLIGRGLPEEEQKQISKRYGGAASGAAAGAAAGAMTPVPWITAPIGAVIGAISGYISQGGNFATILPDIWEGVKGIGAGAWNAVSGGWEKVKEWGGNLWEGAGDLITGEHGLTHGFGLWAKGGPIGKGMLGLVGERGPELFVPQTSGTIIPNDATEKILNMFGGSGGFSADSAGGFVQQPSIAMGQLFESGFLERYFGSMNQGPEIAARRFGGPVSAGHPYLVGEGGAEAFISSLPRFHNGGVVGGGVPNQVYNVTNKMEAPPQQAAPQVIQNTAHVNVSSMDGADAYRVLSSNRDALASIFSEMRLDNNSRLRR